MRVCCAGQQAGGHPLRAGQNGRRGPCAGGLHQARTASWKAVAASSALRRWLHAADLLIAGRALRVRSTALTYSRRCFIACADPIEPSTDPINPGVTAGLANTSCFTLLCRGLCRTPHAALGVPGITAYSRLLQELSPLLPERGDGQRRLLVTGHSVGAGLASIFLQELHARWVSITS